MWGWKVPKKKVGAVGLVRGCCDWREDSYGELWPAGVNITRAMTNKMRVVRREDVGVQRFLGWLVMQEAVRNMWQYPTSGGHGSKATCECSIW